MENRRVEINMAEKRGLGVSRTTAGEKYTFLVSAKEEVIERYVPSGYYES